MMNIRRLWIGLSLAAFLLIIGWVVLQDPAPTLAQIAGDDYIGLDIVFLVDQSGSMGGRAYGSEDHPVANDPYDLRFQGVQQLIERLAGYRINYFHSREGIPSPVRFQTAVLYFGSQVREIVPPTVIDQDTMAQWEPVSARIQPALSAAAFRTNLGNTDHLAALKAAKAILQRMEQSWQGGRHIQVILLLTDGESYVECPTPAPVPEGQPTPTPQPQPAYCRDGKFQLSIYRNMVRDYINAELPAPRYLLYMAAIHADLKELPEFWKTVTGDRAELVDATGMWIFFEKILGSLTVGQDSPIADKKTERGKFEDHTYETRVMVAPYLREMTFIIHKPAPDIRVTLKQNGVPLENLPTTIVRDKDKFIENITIYNPRPGFIDIERPVSTEIVRIFSLSYGANVRCVGNNESLAAQPPVAVPQFIPARLQCELTDSNNQPLPGYEDPRYQLIVEAEIHGPSQSQRLRLTPQGRSTYTAYFVPAQPGDYTIVIAAKSKDPNDKEIEPFREPVYGVGQFTVKRTVPQLRVEGTPTALLPVSVTVRLADVSGADLRVPPEAEPFVTMEALFMAQGKEVMLSLEAGATGYVGTFTPLQPATYQARLRGQVQDPTTGGSFTAFNQEIGNLQVLPPKVMWEGFTSPWPQYRPAPVAFFLADQADRPIASQLDPGLQLEAEAAVKGSNATLPVSLNVAEKASWKGEFVPESAGEYVLQVSVAARDAQGALVPLVQNLPLFPFSIRPMTLARVEIRRPADQAQQPWRDILWRPQPVAIEVAITDKNGKVLQPAAILRDPAAVPLTARIVPPGGGAGRPLALVQAGKEPGVFVASFDDYRPFVWYAHRDLGWYEVQISPQAELNEAHTYGAANLWTARIHLTRHPLWWLLPLLVGLLVGVVTLMTARQTYLHLWPIVGTLRIEGDRMWTRKLREYGKHTLTFTSRDGLPGNLGRIQVRRPFGSKSIQLAVQLKSGIWVLRAPTVFGGYRAPAGGHHISYEVGAGEKPPAGLAPDWKVVPYGLLTLAALAGLGFVIYVIVVSLGR